MTTYLYPAYFHRDEGGLYGIEFPDLPGCFSAGDTLQEALAMAREALSLHLYGLSEDLESLPVPTAPEHVVPLDGAFVVPIEGRPDMARDEIRNRSVKKTLTIPNWLNEEAERNHINFSQVLQGALKARLGV
jgi:predicted RNase H-like HicB family nuclease